MMIPVVEEEERILGPRLPKEVFGWPSPLLPFLLCRPFALYEAAIPSCFHRLRCFTLAKRPEGQRSP